MPPRHRKSAMKVQGGHVLRKNNWVVSPGHPDVLDPAVIPIERRGPGEGYRHVVSVRQLRDVIALLPMWDDVAVGLRAIILDGGSHDTIGWYGWGGQVGLCAWERDLWWEAEPRSWVDRHRLTLDALDVDLVANGDAFDIRWTEAQARAFLLVDTLPHELGHHHDRMTTRSRHSVARGEPFAEEYARRAFDAVWPIYASRFGL